MCLQNSIGAHLSLYYILLSQFVFISSMFIQSQSIFRKAWRQPSCPVQVIFPNVLAQASLGFLELHFFEFLLRYQPRLVHFIYFYQYNFLNFSPKEIFKKLFQFSKFTNYQPRFVPKEKFKQLYQFSKNIYNVLVQARKCFFPKKIDRKIIVLVFKLKLHNI